MAGATIAVASDHAGFDLEEILKRDLQEAGLEVLDLGTSSTQSVDYPDFGTAMADAVASGKAERGVLVCGTGIGILAEADPAIDEAVKGELHRQREQIELIASENIVSRAVLEAAGSVLTNKYAEGYPGRRYYGGCEEVDKAEQLAIDRACKLFNCSFANVQPHSGAQANQAVFMALLQPGDKFMGMALDQGGHLTHGSPANQSGKWFKVVSYGVKPDTHLIDYEQMEETARREKPKLIVAGASAYSRHIDWARFRKVADEIGAFFMVDMAHYAGLVAAGVYPSPLPHAHVVTTTRSEE